MAELSKLDIRPEQSSETIQTRTEDAIFALTVILNLGGFIRKILS